MAYNIFVSYKYADANVKHLNGHFPTTARHYVDEIEKLLAADGHIYYGEHDGDDLSELSDDEIWEELKDRIYPTTCTIVLISPNMNEPNSYDKSQWIPWEICYSIRETVRNDRKSHRNGILAVVLPDKNGSYDYALTSNRCCSYGCTTYHKDWLFTIIKENMFNCKESITDECNRNSIIWHGEFSYIPMVRWDDFKDNVTSCIDRVEKIKDDAENYTFHLSVNK